MAWIPQSASNLSEGAGLSSMVFPVLYWNREQCNQEEMDALNLCTHYHHVSKIKMVLGLHASYHTNQLCCEEMLHWFKLSFVVFLKVTEQRAALGYKCEQE